MDFFKSGFHKRKKKKSIVTFSWTWWAGGRRTWVRTNTRLHRRSWCFTLRTRSGSGGERPSDRTGVSLGALGEPFERPARQQLACPYARRQVYSTERRGMHWRVIWDLTVWECGDHRSVSTRPFLNYNAKQGHNFISFSAIYLPTDDLHPSLL